MAEIDSELAREEHSLDNIKILMEASPEILNDLLARCKWYAFEADDIIVDANDPSTDVYFVVAGRLRAMDFLTDDQHVSFAELEPGDSFGELSAIDLKVRSARITALEPTKLASISSRDFRKLLMDCPGIAMALLKRFAGFIRTLNTRFAAMASMTPHQRIYFELLRLSEPNTADSKSWVIFNVPNHAEIASWVGAERSAVADAIGNLARDGIVERRHKDLVIRDHDRLKRLANE